jgi:DNA-directed RNA polymerase subunit RPC12/RpoP
MTEPKADYLTTQFIAAASKAKHVEHNLFCQICSKETDHALFVSRDYEYYACPKCGWVQIFKVR